MTPRRSRHLARTAVAATSLVLVAPLALPEVANAAVADAEAEVERIVDELDRLHTQADILAEDYAEAVDQKNQLDDDVAEAEVRVAAKEAELGELRGDLSEVAVRAFTGAGEDVLGPLFSSPGQYGEGLQREQYSRVALAVGTVTTDDLDELISGLEADRQELADLREQAEQLTKTIAEKQEQTEQLTAQYEEYRVEAEAQYAEEIRKEEERRAAEAFAQMQAELAAATSNSGGDSSGGGDSGGGDSGGGDSGGGGASAPAPASAPAVSGLSGVAIAAAQSQLGVPYSYATSNPGVSFDCSGLTHYAWGQAGVYLPRNSRAQAASLPRVAPAAAQPGDLIFYYSPISHVGIYLGGGSYIHAPNSGDVVKISGVSWNKVTAVGRPG